MQDEQNLSRARAIRAEAAKIVGPPVVFVGDVPGMPRNVPGWAHRVHMVAHYIQSGEARWLNAAAFDPGSTPIGSGCDNAPHCWYYDSGR